MIYPFQFTKNLYCSHGADQTGAFHCSSTALSTYIIADGHSQREGSADLVTRFLQYFESQQSALQQIEATESNIQEFVKKLLSNFQENIKRELPRSAMSLMIVVASFDYLHVFFLGDCRLGEIDEDQIKWLTRPHSCILQTHPDMSEEELRNSELNHIVFNQFAAKNMKNPEYQKHAATGKKYILCTDGLWKLPLEQQIKAIKSEHSDYDDDIAFLIFTTPLSLRANLS